MSGNKNERGTLSFLFQQKACDKKNPLQFVEGIIYKALNLVCYFVSWTDAFGFSVGLVSFSKRSTGFGRFSIWNWIGFLLDTELVLLIG